MDRTIKSDIKSGTISTLDNLTEKIRSLRSEYQQVYARISPEVTDVIPNINFRNLHEYEVKLQTIKSNFKSARNPELL